MSDAPSRCRGRPKQPCGCTIKWADYFRTHPYTQTVFEVRLSAQGVNQRKAKRVTKTNARRANVDKGRLISVMRVVPI